MPYLKSSVGPKVKVWDFFKQIVNDLEENVAKIYLPDLRFCMLWAIGQSDMSSPDIKGMHLW